MSQVISISQPPFSGRKNLEPYIETLSGIKFYFLDPTADMIDIEDIAHALSNTCRYTGHCRRFYSVAEHSVAVSELTGTLEGLLHDASEAYITDIASPVKPHLTNYKKLESTIQGAVCLKYGVPFPFSEDTHYADLVQLSTEARHLLPSKGNEWRWDEWHVDGRPRRGGIIPRCLSPREAKRLFLRRFRDFQQ